MNRGFVQAIALCVLAASTMAGAEAPAQTPAPARTHAETPARTLGETPAQTAAPTPAQTAAPTGAPTPAQTPEMIDGIAAVVNDSVYTRSLVRAVRELRLIDAPSTASEAKATLALVERRLVLLEAVRFAMAEPTADAVAARRREWSATLQPGFDLAAALQRHGLTEDDLKAWFTEDVRIQAYLGKLFDASAQPTAAEVAAYVRDHEADLVKSGARQTPESLDALATSQLTRDKRQRLIREWIDNLKKRADIAIKIK
jgi:hypothetical protein